VCGDGLIEVTFRHCEVVGIEERVHFVVRLRKIQRFR